MKRLVVGLTLLAILVVGAVVGLVFMLKSPTGGVSDPANNPKKLGPEQRLVLEWIKDHHSGTYDIDVTWIGAPIPMWVYRRTENETYAWAPVVFAEVKFRPIHDQDSIHHWLAAIGGGKVFTWSDMHQFGENYHESLLEAMKPAANPPSTYTGPLFQDPKPEERETVRKLAMKQ
jgi:hypothetical protein